ncbi:MAG: S-layer homology domain-containing protein [Promicromonosporaceae bacterium]|nr:S-layer homology domain-containing protein [Promicromonosporaceae bacterium]
MKMRKSAIASLAAITMLFAGAATAHADNGPEDATLTLTAAEGGSVEICIDEDCYPADEEAKVIEPGTELRVEATPDEDMLFVTWYVTADVEWVNDTTIESNPAYFLMPDDQFIVAAVFTEIDEDGEDGYAWVCPTDDATFEDVPVGAAFHCEIEWLAQTGITTGWEDGTFRPVLNIERQAMAAFLYRGLAEAGVFAAPEEGTFTDKLPTDYFFHQVEWLADSGITTGWDDGTFRPLYSIERQAMAAFLFRAAGEPEFEAPEEPTFSDVPVTDPFFLEIEWMYYTGITTGFDDNTFRPLEGVERQAMAAFLFRAFTGGYLDDANLGMAGDEAPADDEDDEDTDPNLDDDDDDDETDPDVDDEADDD